MAIDNVILPVFVPTLEHNATMSEAVQWNSCQGGLQEQRVNDRLRLWTRYCNQVYPPGGSGSLSVARMVPCTVSANPAHRSPGDRIPKIFVMAKCFHTTSPMHIS